MAKNETEQEMAGRLSEERATTTPERFEGGTTTRDDALDEGVPMAPVDGDPTTYTRPLPEDAGAVGEERENLRGDYSARQPEPHHTSVRIPDEEREDGGPMFKLIDQRTGEEAEHH